jgi:hypothetical protein
MLPAVDRYSSSGAEARRRRLSRTISVADPGGTLDRASARRDQDRCLAAVGGGMRRREAVVLAAKLVSAPDRAADPPCASSASRPRALPPGGELDRRCRGRLQPEPPKIVKSTCRLLGDVRG